MCCIWGHKACDSHQSGKAAAAAIKVVCGLTHNRPSAPELSHLGECVRGINSGSRRPRAPLVATSGLNGFGLEGEQPERRASRMAKWIRASSSLSALRESSGLPPGLPLAFLCRLRCMREEEKGGGRKGSCFQTEGASPGANRRNFKQG